MRFRWCLRLATFAWMTLAVSACIDYQETIRVRRDGSVELTVYATVVEGALPMLRNNPELQQLLLLPNNRVDARRVLPESVGISYWQVEKGPGIQIFDAAITVASIADLQSEIGTISSGQKFQLYLDEDGMMVYRRELPRYPLASDLGLAAGVVRDRLSNSRLVFRIEVPTEIVETNGIRPTPQAVVWETNLLKLREDGFSMMARIRPPHSFPWLAAAGAAIVAVVALVLLRGRRSAAPTTSV